jgi:hypothetical protein
MKQKTEQLAEPAPTTGKVVQTVDTDPTDILGVVKKLGSGKKPEREVAEKTIAEMGPAAVEVLLNVVQAESANYRKKQRCFRFGWVAFVAAVVLPILFIVGRGLITGVWKGMGDYFTFLPSMVGAMGAVAAVTQLHKNAATALASVGDVRAVGALIEVLEVDDKAVQKAAVQAISRLLPQLQASNAELLSGEQRRILNGALLKRKDPVFAATILNAYRQVGTGGELEAVKAVVDGRSRTASDPQVQAAARECLPIIQVRAIREHEVRTLVRASDNPSEPATDLLRPAGKGSDSDELLLRSARSASVDE